MTEVGNQLAQNQLLNEGTQITEMKISLNKFKIVTLIVGILSLAFMGLAGYFIARFIMGNKDLDNAKNQLIEAQAKYSRLNFKSYSLSMAELCAFNLEISSAPKTIPIQQLNFENSGDGGSCMTQFDHNHIPGLKYLNMNGNVLREFSSNNLPDLEILLYAQKPINESSVFIKNYLPYVKEFTPSQPISEFSNNQLNINQLEIATNKFTNNTLLQLSNLTITVIGDLQVSNNKMNKLTSFNLLYKNESQPLFIEISNTQFWDNESMTYSIKRQNHRWSLKWNSYYELKSLRIIGYVNLESFSSNRFPKLTQFSINSTSSTTINEFNGNSLPLVKTLVFPSNTVLKQFKQNTLPLIESLTLVNASLLTFTGNDMREIVNLDLSYNALQSFEIPGQKLKSLNLAHSGDLGGLRYTDLPELQSLSVEHSSSLYEIIGVKADNLQSLKASNCKIKSMSGNSFAQIKSIELNSNSLTAFDISPYTSLKTLNLESNTINTFTIDSQTIETLNLGSNALSKYTFKASPLLKKLNLESNKLTSLTIKDDQLVGLEQLNLNNNPQLISLSINSNSIRILTATKNDLDTIDALKISTLITLDLSGGVLEAIDAVTPLLQSLNLKGNKLADNVVQQLISMEITAIKTIDLSDNPIVDKEKAKSTLQAKYPNAVITI